jgi:DNA replication and repair protein RecF
MLLESLETHNWRNTSGKMICGKGLNIIYGDNGQGKTNWLEAIYLLATTKSFRTQRLQEAFLYNQNLAVVRGRVASAQDIHRDLQVTLENQSKQITINGKREPVTRYLDQLHVIAFTADELEVVRGGPEARRRFVDKGVVALQAGYTQTLANYNRVIKQKNKLLQDAAAANFSFEETSERLRPWHEQLITLSAVIHRAREAYVDKLNQSFNRRLFDSEEVSVRYVSALEGKGNLEDYEALIEQRLKLRLQAELSAGYSLVGPHRDDLEIAFDGRNIRTYGSSGQQRSALITLDLAAIQVYHTWHKEFPIFIIDDVDAELDRKRIDALLNHVQGCTQTFITTSKEELVERHSHGAAVFEVTNGLIDRADVLSSTTA